MKSILMEKWGSCAGCVPLDPQLFLQCFSVIRANYTHGAYVRVYNCISYIGYMRNSRKVLKICYALIKVAIFAGTVIICRFA